MAAQSLELSSELSQTAQEWQRRGWRMAYAGWNGRVTGLLGLGETMREETAVTIFRLQRLNLSVAVLTGDDKIAGERWQKTLGVPVFAEQLPEDKVAHLREISGAVAMIGDGINDGPALAAAAVGLSVSQGTDVAQSAADAVMLGDDLRDIPWLITLARASMRKVRQNLAWAFVYNIVGLALAMSGQLQPELAALFMVASNIIVTSNALRLRKIVFSDLHEENDHPLLESSDRLSVKSDYQIPITEI